MSQELALGYVAGTSFLHRWDPVTKLIGLLGVIALAIGAPIDYNAAMLVGLLLLTPFSGVDLKTFLKPWKILIPLWIPFIILPPVVFQLQGNLMGLEADLGHLHLFGYDIPYSKFGLNYGLKIAARGTVIGIASLLVIWTTHPRDLVQAIVEDLGAPYKYAWSAFLALVYVPIVQYESSVRDYALRIRGVKYRKLSLHGLKVYAMPVVFRSLRRGFASALSMEARGFGVSRTRTFRYDMHYPKHVVLIRILLVIGFGILVALALASGRFTMFVNS
jgi:energy-coupling factor transport system permease protein